jgi:hypothetical protein
MPSISSMLSIRAASAMDRVDRRVDRVRARAADCARPPYCRQFLSYFIKIMPKSLLGMAGILFFALDFAGAALS